MAVFIYVINEDLEVMDYNFRVLTTINTYLSQWITPALIKKFATWKSIWKELRKNLMESWKGRYEMNVWNFIWYFIGAIAIYFIFWKSQSPKVNVKYTSYLECRSVFGVYIAQYFSKIKYL